MEHRLLCRTHCYTILYNTIQYNTIQYNKYYFVVVFSPFLIIICSALLPYSPLLHSLTRSLILYCSLQFCSILSCLVLLCPFSTVAVTLR